MNAAASTLNSSGAAAKCLKAWWFHICDFEFISRIKNWDINHAAGRLKSSVISACRGKHKKGCPTPMATIASLQKLKWQGLIFNWKGCFCWQKAKTLEFPTKNSSIWWYAAQIQSDTHFFVCAKWLYMCCYGYETLRIGKHPPSLVSQCWWHGKTIIRAAASWYRNTIHPYFSVIFVSAHTQPTAACLGGGRRTVQKVKNTLEK